MRTVKPEVLVLLAAAVPAQVVPGRLTATESPFLSSLPFGSGARVRVQQVLHRGLVGSMTAQRIALRGNGGVQHPGNPQVELEIGMGHTPLDPFAMDPAFANNRGADYGIVFQRRILDLPALAGAQMPQPFDIAFPLDSGFGLRARPGHVLVEWVVYAGGNNAANYQVDGAGFDGSRGTPTGTPCNTGPEVVIAAVQGAGSRLECLVDGGSFWASGVGVHVLGTAPLATPIPLPGGGCLLRQDLLSAVALPVDATGRCTMQYPLPITAKGQRVQTQFVLADPTLSRLGSTQSTSTWIGGYDAMNSSYSRSFSHTAGVVGRGGGPVLRFD